MNADPLAPPLGRGPFTLSDFDYELPPELIAQAPVPVRGGSRLLVIDRTDRSLQDRTFANLALLIPPGDLLVLNSTKVRHARFLGRRASGAEAEVLLIHPAAGDTWVAMGRPGSALKPGKRIDVGKGVAIETLEVLPDGHRVVRFVGASAEDAINRFGILPLPPYIERPPTGEDEERYQTVYAAREGSVAAPTAGLHFTPELLTQLRVNGVRIAELDLEVGPGTFKPVETERLAEHVMHAERFEISPELATVVRETKASQGAIWAVGTTVVRALESAAQMDGSLQTGTAETQLFITPGFGFRVVDRLLTNFHLPRSTLLMLVSAFAGYDLTMAAYRHAVEQRYRFYSYGDATVIL